MMGNPSPNIIVPTSKGYITTAPSAYQRIIGPQISGERIQQLLCRTTRSQMLMGRQHDTLWRRIYWGWSKNTEKIFQTIKMMQGYGRKPNLGEKERRRVISMEYEHQIYIFWFLGHHLPDPPNRTVHNNRFIGYVHKFLSWNNNNTNERTNANGYEDDKYVCKSTPCSP
ncbi:unnamed protein product [Lactuca saligna]|uniref:Uncharacterized protein n=1 Tax=Lactuca saligna TaxID=75948 RepID=A0AA35ZYK3_LACSI|nr:unnamed protein product [Lactuca saligna]